MKNSLKLISTIRLSKIILLSSLLIPFNLLASDDE
jgi:hypothetical protein